MGFGDLCKIECFYKRSTLLSHLQSTDIDSTACKSLADKITDAVNILSGICDDDDDGEMNVDDNDVNDDAKLQRAMKFCLQQLRLLLMKQVRYPVDFLRWAFQAFSLSPSAYFFLRDSCLLLPHPTYLRTLSSCFEVDAGTECNEHIAYLTEKAKLLTERERYVTLLLDEIYVNPKVSYKAGTVAGFAENGDMEHATTVQAFMIYPFCPARKIWQH